MSGATGEKGPWVIGLDMPSYLPAMQFCKVHCVCVYLCVYVYLCVSVCVCMQINPHIHKLISSPTYDNDDGRTAGCVRSCTGPL